jgi:DNA ligase (NAD+)
LLKEVRIENPVESSSGKLSGMTFVITGTLKTLSRDEAKVLIEEHGGKVSGSVSKVTTYLLAGEGGGNKRKDAEKFGVQTIDEEYLTKLVL